MMDFTFGIITAGNNDTMIIEIIKSIIIQNIPNYEIVIVGNTTIEEDKKLIRIPFDESVKPGWITKKKNIICSVAKYENIVLMHDYFILDDDWYEGFLKFGNDFDICTTKINDIYNKRFRDYTILTHGIHDYFYKNILIPYEIPVTSVINKLLYISGGSFIIKKHIALKYPLNEDLVWAQSEDIELSHRLKRDGILLKNNRYSTFKLLKVKNNDCTLLNDDEIKLLLSIDDEKAQELFMKQIQVFNNGIKEFNKAHLCIDIDLK